MRTKRYRTALLVLLCFFFVLSCGEKGHVRVSDDELPGSYVARFQTGEEELILRRDKTYEQIFTSPAKQFTNQGKWKTTYVFLEGTDVQLVDANCSEETTETAVRCSRTLNVHKQDGELSLALNEAADWYYVRQVTGRDAAPAADKR